MALRRFVGLAVEAVTSIILDPWIILLLVLPLTLALCFRLDLGGGRRILGLPLWGRRGGRRRMSGIGGEG